MYTIESVADRVLVDVQARERVVENREEKGI